MRMRSAWEMEVVEWNPSGFYTYAGWRHDRDRASRSRKCGGNEFASFLLAGMTDAG